MKKLLKDLNLTEKFDVIKAWYDGYKTKDGLTLYNPWSLMEYVDLQEPKNYWVLTGNVDEFIKKAIINANDSVKNNCSY